MTVVPLLKGIILLGVAGLAVSGKLSINGNKFYVHEQETFLSGGDLPWASYGFDFGNGQWQFYPKQEYTRILKALHDSGGNSMRVWVHMQGEVSPVFDGNGYVIGTDDQDTFISDFTELLDIAHDNEIFIIPTLWVGNIDQDHQGHLDGLLKHEQKLQSYFDNALTPWVSAVKDHPALGAWDIVNEPEGMLIPEQENEDPCYDTASLEDSGIGWAGQKYTFQQWLKFINWHAAAIKAVDPLALITVGVWNPKSNVDILGFTNHYSDECLVRAGGKPEGTLDFWQYHSDSWQNKFDEVSPFVHNATDYEEDRPIVVGKFWEQNGGGMSNTELFNFIYSHGYNGAWSWDLHGHLDQLAAVESISALTVNGAIPVDI